jgi:hypothetical protein
MKPEYILSSVIDPIFYRFPDIVTINVACGIEAMNVVIVSRSFCANELVELIIGILVLI